MAKRRFQPADIYRLKTASAPDLSPDGRRLAFSLAEIDQDKDRALSSIRVAPLDASSEPRRFTEDPADSSPRWSPDGRWLAYLSVTDENPRHAHVRLAPLDGGAPLRLGDLPGPITQFTWSPDSKRLAVACRVGVPDPEKLSAAERNAARVPRGLAARLDGVGWYEGRVHLFLVDVGDGSSTQLTRGEYDHSDPAFSPDGTHLAFVSDRHPRRDDRQFRSDVWIIPTGGGRPRRLTGGHGRAGSPVFSPDGTLLCFAGTLTDAWDADEHAFVVPADGSGPPEQIAPDTDRPVYTAAQTPPVAWTGAREITMLIADRGSVALHRARIGQAASREIVGGDIQIDGFSARAGRSEIVFTASWPDRPSEVYRTNRVGDQPVPVTSINADLIAEVELSPVSRHTITRPDGTEVEYFTIAPPGNSRGRLPLHLDIHGGPHGTWPFVRRSAIHQSLAAAGYLVLLPNPRGSCGYGQEFTAACTHDWGGEDCADILACCDDLVERGVADSSRMFVAGYSYGGFMTSWLVGHTDRFRAATAGAAVIDERSMALTTDVPGFVLFNMGGTPWEQPDEYDKRSPLHYLPNVTTPVLVLHMEGDIRVPIGQGEELYAGLRLLDKKAELLRYPGGFHVSMTPSQLADYATRVIAWNHQHDARRRKRVRPTRH
jgi:dipeptidyl aminopeptidase/acylaminoacyl peptidase